MMRTASLISILIGISLLITVIFTLMWGKERAFYLLLLGLSIMAIGMAGGTVYEAEKKFLEKKRFFVSLLMTGIFLSILGGIEIAFILILLWLFISAFWIAGGIINEERKKLIDTEKICAICGRGIPLDAETCQYCWNKASREIEMFRHYRNI